MKKRMIFMISAVAFVIILTVSILIFSDRKQEVSVANFDNTMRLSFGEYKLKEIVTKDKPTPITSIEFNNEKEEKKFLDYIDAMDSYIGIYDFGGYKNLKTFLSEGFYYTIRKTDSEHYEIEPVYAHVVFDEAIAANDTPPMKFIYFDLGSYSIEEKDYTIETSRSKEAFFDFYEKTNGTYVRLDREHDCVYVIGVDFLSDEKQMDHLIKLTYVDGRVKIEYIRE